MELFDLPPEAATRTDEGTRTRRKPAPVTRPKWTSIGGRRPQCAPCVQVIHEAEDWTKLPPPRHATSMRLDPFTREHTPHCSEHADLQRKADDRKFGPAKTRK